MIEERAVEPILRRLGFHRATVGREQVFLREEDDGFVVTLNLHGRQMWAVHLGVRSPYEGREFEFLLFHQDWLSMSVSEFESVVTELVDPIPDLIADLGTLTNIVAQTDDPLAAARFLGAIGQKAKAHRQLREFLHSRMQETSVGPAYSDSSVKSALEKTTAAASRIGIAPPRLEIPPSALNLDMLAAQIEAKQYPWISEVYVSSPTRSPPLQLGLKKPWPSVEEVLAAIEPLGEDDLRLVSSVGNTVDLDELRHA